MTQKKMELLNEMSRIINSVTEENEKNDDNDVTENI